MACRRFGRSPATGDAVDLLADVLGRTREAAGELAKIAGDRGSAAQQGLSVISWAGHIMRCKSHGYANEEEK
ncbi:hypothetical protein DB771_17825, partial [Burkholderia sp. AU29985]